MRQFQPLNDLAVFDEKWSWPAEVGAKKQPACGGWASPLDRQAGATIGTSGVTPDLCASNEDG